MDADKFADGRQHFIPRGEIAIERAERYPAGVADVPHRQSPRPHFADRAPGPVQDLQDASGMVALDALLMDIGWGQDSEGRSVGKKGVSTCSSRGLADH